MKKVLDRITEAYFGELGKEFGKKTQDRIHWVCKQTKGKKVLDVGCSQGITSILLAREGMRVLAIDVLEKSIQYAKNMLEQEQDTTKELVDFQTSNFVTHDFYYEKFDTIIFSEVLEHITDPYRFLAKAETLLNKNGKIVITLPFGINDWPHHKKTYYIVGILNILPDTLKISDYQFLGNWLGLIVEKNIKGIELYKLFSDMENNFYLKERALIDSRRELQKRYEEILNKYELSKIVSHKEKVDLELELTQLQRSRELTENEFREQKLDLELKLLQIQKEKEFTDKKFRKQRSYLESKLVQAQKEFESYDNNEVVQLNNYVELQKSYEKLLKEHSNLEHKYKALSNSKLNKLTLSYWKWKRKRK